MRAHKMNDMNEPDDFEEPPRSIAEAKKLGRQIDASYWRGNTRGTLWVAKECNHAKHEFTERGLTALRRAADMGKTTFLQLADIGNDLRLSRS